MIERVDRDAFDGPRLRRPGVVAVGFLADWCGFCDEFLPELRRLADEGRTVLHADLTDLDSPLWETFRVDVVPTLLVFRDGAEVFRADGVRGVGLSAKDLAAARAAMNSHVG